MLTRLGALAATLITIGMLAGLLRVAKWATALLDARMQGWMRF